MIIDDWFGDDHSDEFRERLRKDSEFLKWLASFIDECMAAEQRAKEGKDADNGEL